MTVRPKDFSTFRRQTFRLCSLCPRRCNIDRSRELGWCRMDDRIHISSIVIHRGEEPPISGEKGIVNVFFPSCNMQCIYCQNGEISCRGTEGTVMTLDEVCNAIIELLSSSENNLGFVSPSHCILQMVSIVEELRQRGHNPTIVYNTNGYDLPETLRSLEGIVDVWLPDFKYSDDTLAVDLSEAPRYSEYALAALKEMVRQVGTTLYTDEKGIARRGIIIRHLVLPGFAENSIVVITVIAEELSPHLHISLMSQYYPPDRMHPTIDPARNQAISPDPETTNNLLRTVNRQEYNSVIKIFFDMGLHHGWRQDYASHLNYRPCFSEEDPFKEP